MRAHQFVIAGILALGVATPALAATTTGYGKGGKTKEFATEVERQQASGELMRIKGHCQSACTMFLAVKNSCVEPSARLLFHAGNTPEATSRMFNSYNSSLRAYLSARGAMNSKAFHTVSGADMINKFGYRACPK